MVKEIFRAYKFKLQPTQKQVKLLDKHFGCTRWVYNHFLAQRIEQHKQHIETKEQNIKENKDEKEGIKYITKSEQNKQLPALKKDEKTQWLKEVNSQSLQYAVECVDTAYKNFFRRIKKGKEGKKGHPKFKKKHNHQSFTCPQHCSIVQSKVKVIKFKEGIKCIIDRDIIGTIQHMTFSKTPTGKYFISITTKEQYIPKQKTGEKRGLDLGLKDFVITNEGERYKNNRYTKKYAAKLKKVQQHLSRKIGAKKGEKASKSFENQRRKVAKIHEKIANSRKDNLHKISTKLISEYDIICIEDLKVKNMVRNKKLAKHIADVSWGEFVRMLEYKASWNDKEVIKIDTFYPSSKRCNECGDIKKNLTLADREWVCKKGHTLDRDINAARNILDKGLELRRVAANTGVETVQTKAS